MKLERSVGLDAFPKYRQENADKSELPFLLLFVGFTIFVFVMETYLDLRQHKNLKATTAPPALLEVLETVDEDNKGLGAVSKARDFPTRRGLGLSPPLCVAENPFRCDSIGARMPCSVDVATTCTVSPRTCCAPKSHKVCVQCRSPGSLLLVVVPVLRLERHAEMAKLRCLTPTC